MSPRAHWAEHFYVNLAAVVVAILLPLCLYAV